MRRFLLLLLVLPTPIEAQATLSGRVLTADGTQPIAEVEVSLPVLDRRAATKADGSFTFPDLPPGMLRIAVRRIGYEPMDVVRQIPSRGTLELEFRLISRGVVLDPIEVTAQLERHRVHMAEFEQRRKAGIGAFVTRNQLEKREGLSLRTLLREYGVGVGPSLRSRVTSINRNCPSPQLVVDGVRRDYKDLLTFQLHELEGIEIYTGSARVPVMFEFGDASCGVVVLWTRIG